MSQQRSFNAKIKCEPSSDGKSEPCCRSRCQTRNYKLLKTKIKVKHLTLEKRFWTGTNLVVYLIKHRSCSKQYVGSTITPFRFARKLSKVNTKKCNIYQEQFHRQFNSDGHNEMED